jgi:hypothetical protein
MYAFAKLVGEIHLQLFCRYLDLGLANADDCIAISYYGPYMHQCLLSILLMPRRRGKPLNRAPLQNRIIDTNQVRWDYQCNKARLVYRSLLRILR